VIRRVFVVGSISGFRLEGVAEGPETTIAGTLHDEGGRPSVVVGAAGTVHGRLHEVADGDRHGVDWLIDVVHATHAQPCAQTIAPTGCGVLAYAFHATTPPASPAIGDGRWRDPQPTLI
jgi:hypothetical protein